MGRILKPWIAAHPVVSGEVFQQDPDASHKPHSAPPRLSRAAIPWLVLLASFIFIEAFFGSDGTLKRIAAQLTAAAGTFAIWRRDGSTTSKIDASLSSSKAASKLEELDYNDASTSTYNKKESAIASKDISEPYSRADSGYASSIDGESLTSPASPASPASPDSSPSPADSEDSESSPAPIRSVPELLNLYKSGLTSTLTDPELATLVSAAHVPSHALESLLSSPPRAVSVRRLAVSSSHPSLATLPHAHALDYTRVAGRCAENVVGYVPLPVGLAGPLILDGENDLPIPVPMATTEGALIASTSRGCKALNQSGGVRALGVGDGMTRGPVVSFADAGGAALGRAWTESEEGWEALQRAFAGTTTHGSLESVSARVAGRYLYLRFRASTGEAMGMNMMSKGVERALQEMARQLPGMEIVALSGNVCSDKKAAAINWIEGRGKSVVAECVLPQKVVQGVLRTTVSGLVSLGIAKNLVGSAMAGASSGGFNAHAANVVAAVFLATGQDAAQVVSSSNCLTMFEETPDGDLRASVTMPSIEVGTIGGGTELPAQTAMLELLGCASTAKNKGENAMRLARIIAGTVLASELSLCAALSKGDLVKSHMQHNRKTEK